MKEDHLSRIQLEYQQLLRQGQTQHYLQFLCDDALNWWFNMDIFRISAHLAPLQLDEQHYNSHPRLGLLEELSRNNLITESFERLYQSFVELNDHSAAMAATQGAIASIWDSGRDFRRYIPWYNRLKSLIESRSGLSPLALASAFGFKGLVELTGFGEPRKASESYRKQMYWAEQAGSNALRLFSAVGNFYSLLWQGRFSEIDVIFSDAIPLYELEDIPLMCKIYFQIAFAFYLSISGDPDRARAILQKIINHPSFEMISPPAFYLAYGHLLYAQSCRGTEKDIEEISIKIRKSAIPSQNFFHHAYLHFNLGIAYLRIGMPYRALIHSELTISKGILSQSPIPEMISALLKGQALADLGEHRQAMRHFKFWIPRWKELGFDILCSAAAFEMAKITALKGQIDEAREHYNEGCAFLPDRQAPVYLYRPVRFFEELNSLVFQQSETSTQISIDTTRVPIQIKTFGRFTIRIGDTVIYDRKWRGRGTKRLLKALIVCGGTKVSTERLVDLLWPDSDSDRAFSNLKVSLSRLRRIGSHGKDPPYQWIVVKQKQISLVHTLCFVDSIVFLKTLSNVLNISRDANILMQCLDLYTDDFLVNDSSEIWIIRHREFLKNEFIRGVTMLYEFLRYTEQYESALPYLHRAVEKDPLNEEIYSYLMQTYIDLGFPSTAVKIFRKAREALKEELDIEPGPILMALARKAGAKDLKS